MSGDDGDVGEEAEHRKGEEPWEAVAVGAPGGDFEDAAGDHQASRGDQNPELVLVQEVVNFSNRTSE